MVVDWSSYYPIATERPHGTAASGPGSHSVCTIAALALSGATGTAGAGKKTTSCPPSPVVATIRFRCSCWSRMSAAGIAGAVVPEGPPSRPLATLYGGFSHNRPRHAVDQSFSTSVSAVAA